MKPETVFILSHSFAPNVGGVETHLTDMANYLQSKDVPTFILCYQPLVTPARGKTFEHFGSVTLCRLPSIGFGLFNKFEPYPLVQFLYLFPVLFLVSFFVTLFNRKNIAVIHCHGMVCSVMGRLLKSVFGVRIVVSIHAVYGWLYDLKSNRLLPRFLRWVLTGTDKVLALSRASRKELLAMGLSETQTETFTYWSDQVVFHPMDKADCRKKAGLKDMFTVLFVGRLIAVKGVETLMEVAAALPDIQFVFAGDGPLADSVSRNAASHENIRYPGRVDNTSLPTFYNAADLLCVPSQYEEGFGRIIIEALSCGTPVIGSRRGGIPEALDESVGVLLEPTTPEIRGVIEDLKSHPEKLNRLKQNCRPYAEKNFGLANAARIVDAYYG